VEKNEAAGEDEKGPGDSDVERDGKVVREKEGRR
jgi:hypothetical protein